MAGPILGFTSNYGFAKLNFDAVRWGNEHNKNFDLLDALLTSLGIAVTKGFWENSTPYLVSERVVDVSGSVYICNVTHTSPSSGTFSADRTANPTRWQLSTLTAVNGYLGEKTVLPTLDNNGNPLVNGALVSLIGQTPSSLDGMYVRRSNLWQSVISPFLGSFAAYRYVATAAQTVITGADANGGTLAYMPGALMVTVNGVTLAPNTYTATDGTSVVLGTALSASDAVVVYSFGSFSVPDVPSQAEAEAGTNNTKFMTPLRTRQAGQFAEFTPAGTGAQIRTIQSKLRDIPFVDDYRLTGDSDDAAAFGRAITETGIARARAGATYNVGSQVVITRDDAVIDLRGATINAAAFRAVTLAQPNIEGVFHFQGSLLLQTTLAASPAKYATTLTLTSATGVQPGDAIFMVASGASTQHWYTEGSTVVRRSIVSRIAAVSGSNVTIETPLPFDFDVSAGSVNVFIWRGVKRGKVLGGRIIGPGYVEPRNNGSGESGITAHHAQDIEVLGTSVHHMQGAVGWFSRVHSFSWVGGDHIGRPYNYTAAVVEGDNAFFSGIWAYESAAANFDRIKGVRLRHLIDGARTQTAVVSNCFAYDCHRHPYTTHTGCNNWTWINCNSDSDNGGLLWRSFDFTVIGGNFRCPNDAEAAIYDNVGAATDLPKTIKLIGVKAEAKREAVLIQGNVGYLLIDGCDLVGGSESTSYMPVSLHSLDLEHAEIRGGRIETISGGDCIRAPDNSPRKRNSIIVTGTRFVNFISGAAVRVWAGSSGIDHFSVKDCVFVPGVGHSSSVPDNFVRRIGTVRVFDRSSNFFNGTRFHPIETWAPGTDFTVGDGTDNVTLNVDLLNVSRNGNVLTITGRIRITSLGSATGNMQINLPVTIAQWCGGEVVFYSSVALGSVGMKVTLRGAPGETRLRFFKNNSATASSSVTAAELTAAGDIVIVATVLT